MTKTNEMNKTTIPEIIMDAAKLKVERKVSELTLFLAPLPSERAKELLRKVKNLGAAAEFADSTYECWEECHNIAKELDNYLNPEYYYDILSDCAITPEQQRLLIDISITHYNAKRVAYRYFADSMSSHESTEAVLCKLADTIIQTLQIILLSMDEEMPNDDVCRILNAKIHRLNKTLISLENKIKVK